MHIRNGKKNKDIIMQFLVLFGMEFDIPHVGFASFRKIVFAILLFYCLRCKKMQGNIQKNVALAVGAVSLLFVYGWFVFRLRFGEYEQIPVEAYNIKTPIILMLDMIIFPVLTIKIFNSVEEFIRCQWRVTLLQSAIVFIGRLIRPVRMFVFENFAYGDGRLEEGVYNGVRSVGIDLAGAAGSVVLFAGLICGIYLFYQTRDRKKKNNIIIGFMLIIAANLFMGRTGLYFSVIALGIVFIDAICKLDRSALRLVAGSIIILAGCLIYVFFAPNTWGLRTWIRWVTEIGDLFGKERTISAILNMNIPPLTMETLFGTGLYSGMTKMGVSFSHDAGYIRTYTSIGLIGCGFYYGSIYGFYLLMINKVKSSKKKRIYLFFLLAIAIAEMKEPFMAKTPLTMIMSCMLILETSPGKHFICNEEVICERNEQKQSI